MNKKILADADIFAVKGGLFILSKHGPRIFWKSIGVYGDGEQLDSKALASVSARDFNPVRVDGAIHFYNKSTVVKVPLLEATDVNSNIPTTDKVSTWDKRISKVALAAEKKFSDSIAFAGALFEPSRVLASNGFRMHGLDIQTPAEEPIVIPARALEVIGALRPTHYGFVDDGIYARGESWIAWSPATPGGYPPYKHIFPKEFLDPPVRLLNKRLDTLKEVVKVAKSLHTNASVAVLEDGGIEIYLPPEGVDPMHVDNMFTPLPIPLVVHGVYLLQALEYVGKDAIIQISSEKTPMLLRGDGTWAIFSPLRT